MGLPGTYPKLGPKEIAASLTGWGMQIREEQLLKPTPEFVQTVYCACLHQVTSITHEKLHEPVLAALETVDDASADLYQAALAHSIILSHLVRFAGSATVNGFCGRDLSQPTSSRTIDVLSGFINFIKYTDQASDPNSDPFVEKIKEKLAKTVSDREQEARQLAKDKQRIAALQSRLAEDKPECERLEKENARLISDMFKVREQQENSILAVETLKNERNNLSKSKESLDKEIVTLKSQVEQTQARVVQSPERLRSEIASMGINAAENKRKLTMHEASMRDLQVKINALLSIEKDLRGCVEQLQTIEKETNLLQNSSKQAADLKDTLDKKQIVRSELQMTQENVNNQFVNAQDRLDRAQRHADDKKIAGQNSIDRLQREYNQMSVERKENEEEMEQLRAEASGIERAIAEHLRRNQEELNELLAQYWNLRYGTDIYMDTLANKLNMKIFVE